MCECVSHILPFSAISISIWNWCVAIRTHQNNTMKTNLLPFLLLLLLLHDSISVYAAAGPPASMAASSPGSLLILLSPLSHPPFFIISLSSGNKSFSNLDLQNRTPTFNAVTIWWIPHLFSVFLLCIYYYYLSYLDPIYLLNLSGLVCEIPSILMMLLRYTPHIIQVYRWRTKNTIWICTGRW